MKKISRPITLILVLMTTLFTGATFLTPAHATDPVTISFNTGDSDNQPGASVSALLYHLGETVTVPSPSSSQMHLGGQFSGWCATGSVNFLTNCPAAQNGGRNIYQPGDTFTVSEASTLTAVYLPISCVPNQITTSLSGNVTIYTAIFTSTPDTGCRWTMPDGIAQADVLQVGAGGTGGANPAPNYFAGGGGQLRIWPLITNTGQAHPSESISIRVGVSSDPARNSETSARRDTENIHNEHMSSGNNVYTSYTQYMNSSLNSPNVQSAVNGSYGGAGQKSAGTFPNGGEGIRPSEIAAFSLPDQNKYVGLFNDDTTCYGGGGGIVLETTTTATDGCGRHVPNLIGQDLLFDTPTANTGAGASVVIQNGVLTYGPLSDGLVKIRYVLQPHEAISYHAADALFISNPPFTYYEGSNSPAVAASFTGTPPANYVLKAWCTANPPSVGSACPQGATQYSPGANITTTPNVDIDLYAVWENALTITYDSNGGTGLVPTDPASYASGSSVPALGAAGLTNAGFDFLGWCTVQTQVNQGCATAGGERHIPDFFGAAVTVTRNTTLYAIWGNASSNNAVNSVVFSQGTLSPAYSANTHTYDLLVPHDASSITVTLVQADPRSFLLEQDGQNDAQILTSGSPSSAIALNSNTVTVINIGAVAESVILNGDLQAAANVYVVNINHAATTPPSQNVSINLPEPAPVVQTTPVVAALPQVAPPQSLVVTPGSPATQQLVTPTGTTWAIDGGANQTLFTVTPSGALTLAPNQAPGKYVVNLVSTDATGARTTQVVTVVVPGTPKLVVTTSTDGLPVVAVTDPIDETPKLAVIGTDKGVTASVTSTGSLKIEDPTFSGNVNVQLQASNQYGLSASTSVNVVINPDDVTNVAAKVTTTSVQQNPNSLAKTATVVTWEPSINATAYQVKVDGKVVGKTTASSLSVANIYGPAHTVEVIPLGNDGTQGSAIATSIPVTEIAVGSLNFANNSAILSKTQKKLLDKLASTIKVSGITTVRLNGIVQQIGAGTTNQALAAARATAVKTYLQSKVVNTAIQFVVSANKKVSAASKSVGTNRVDVVVR